MKTLVSHSELKQSSEGEVDDADGGTWTGKAPPEEKEMMHE